MFFLSLVIDDQVFYKEDLTWMKGIGCYVWDTPEIIRAKKAYDLQSEVRDIKQYQSINHVKPSQKYTTHILPFSCNIETRPRRNSTITPS